MRPSLRLPRSSPRHPRTARSIAAAALLAGLLAAPVAAVTPGGASEETVTGVLEAIQVEGRDGSDPIIYSVRDGHRVTPVRFGRGDPGRLAGARVSVLGQRRGGVLEVASATPGRDVRLRSKPHAQPLGA